ncbi:MAG: hypothetical protein LLG04_08305 [Parachlamydia sp.]|nr:hypothetical protein [Parachlamydia sp.]
MAKIIALKQLSPEFEPLLQKGMLNDMAPLDIHSLDPENLCLLGALEGDTPIGLAAAILQPNFRIAELKVLTAFTLNSVGRELLEKLERELAKRNVGVLMAVYPSHSPIHPLLQACNWESPRVVLTSCYFISHLFSPSWYLKAYRLPKGFAYFPWEKLTQDDKHTIQKLWEKGDISSDIYPFYEETVFEPNSLGLRYQGKLVGWSLAESHAPQSLWYSKLYLDPAFRLTGIAIQLLAASILRHDHVRFPNVYFKLNLVQSSLRWLRFVKRRLIPYADSVTEYYQMWHKIQ